MRMRCGWCGRAGEYARAWIHVVNLAEFRISVRHSQKAGSAEASLKQSVDLGHLVVRHNNIDLVCVATFTSAGTCFSKIVRRRWWQCLQSVVITKMLIVDSMRI